MSREELKKALLTIKKECKRNHNCDHCMTKDILGTPHCLDIEPHQWFTNKNEEIYLKTIERLKCCGVDVDDEKEVIAALASEIDEYRSGIKALTECK